MELYKVSILPTENVETVNGYLAFCNRIQFYTKNEAHKKAKYFNGKVEKVDTSFFIDTVSTIQLRYNEIPNDILLFMKPNQVFKDLINDEEIYLADIFNDILDKNLITDPISFEKLNMLNSLSTYHQYIQLIK